MKGAGSDPIGIAIISLKTALPSLKYWLLSKNLKQFFTISETNKQAVDI